MKAFMVIALAALASAEPPANYGAPSRYQQAESAYGVPAAQQAYPQQQQIGYGAPQAQAYDNGGGYGAPARGQVFRHVYVHAAPDEPVFAENKVIRVPGGGDKHVNIIFVKAPTHSYNHQTEVILPEQAQQKTVVYVLVKKPENYNNVKVTGPGPVRPQKPEVFFIRYKNKEEVAPAAYGVPSAYGAPAVAQQQQSAEYGVPAALVQRGYQ